MKLIELLEILFLLLQKKSSTTITNMILVIEVTVTYLSYLVILQFPIQISRFIYYKKTIITLWKESFGLRAEKWQSK